MSFLQVATYADDKLSIRESDTVFYSKDDSPLTWSQRPLTQCDVNHDCLQCVDDVSKDVLFIKGDFYVVGILPIHEKNLSSSLTCGKIKPFEGADLAESLVFAVKEINKKEGMFEVRTLSGVIFFSKLSVPLLLLETLEHPDWWF